jgi:Bacterial PH domain
MVGPPSSARDRPEVAPPRTGRVDSAGRYHDRAKYSAWNIGAYLVLLVVVYLLVHSSGPDYWVPYALAAAVILLLVRYLSTRYLLDDTSLRATRLLGGRRIALEDIRQIDYASLRDLSPVGFFGSWGWRGRMWSPQAGTFDSIYTDTYGLLVTTTGTPLFISPADPAEFARELSRRVRSFTGPLELDVGDPAQQRAKAMPTF